MKTGQVIKNKEKSTVSQQELELINQYTRRELSADEVYTFSVVLCDNDVDRDFERFTVEALFVLEKLFVGKTGVFDHNPKAQNQTARIYSCKVEAIEGRKTGTGDDYFRLCAKAYLPKSEKNKDIILSIDSGIQKEVSVGCAVEKVICSVCGKEIKSTGCNHIKGKTYNGKLCYGEMINPTDAYEWSFVAVPAQRQAGVIKGFNKNRKDMNMTEIIKALENSQEISLSQHESKKLFSYIEQLKKQAQDGIAYRNALESEVIKLSLIVQPEISQKTIESIVSKLSIEELKEFNYAFEKKAAQIMPPKPQLFAEQKENLSRDKNTQFTI